MFRQGPSPCIGCGDRNCFVGQTVASNRLAKSQRNRLCHALQLLFVSLHEAEVQDGVFSRSSCAFSVLRWTLTRLLLQPRRRFHSSDKAAPTNSAFCGQRKIQFGKIYRFPQRSRFSEGRDTRHTKSFQSGEGQKREEKQMRDR